MSRSISCEQITTDVLVIGAGGAGCCAAMAASDLGARVLLLDKGRLGLSGATYDPFTRGKGLTVALSEYGPTDNPEVHYGMAAEAGCGLADPLLMRLVAFEAPAAFRELLAHGFPFRPNRLGACFGEGLIGAVIEQPELARAFRGEIKQRPIRVLERTMAFRLLMHGGRCTGAMAVRRDGELIAISAGATVLATGGAASIFRYNLSLPGLTGDGHVMALEAGASVANIEFYQCILGTVRPVRTFFPQWYLAGAPAMTDIAGQPFLTEYLAGDLDPGELLRERSLHGPFTSSRRSGQIDLAIDAVIRAGRGTAQPVDQTILAGIQCDFAGLPGVQRAALDAGVGRPALAWLRARGIDFEAGPVSIAPFAHAFNGGIVIDEHGETGVPGLFACGEVAAGPHGANRVGGHMMAVVVVFGARAGRHAAESLGGGSRPPLDQNAIGVARASVTALARPRQRHPGTVRRAIQRAMSPVMIAKDALSLTATLESLDCVLHDELPIASGETPQHLVEALSVTSLCHIAALVARSALLRSATLGPHYRTDSPDPGVAPASDESLIWSGPLAQPAVRWARLASRTEVRA